MKGLEMKRKIQITIILLIVATMFLGACSPQAETEAAVPETMSAAAEQPLAAAAPVEVVQEADAASDVVVEPEVVQEAEAVELESAQTAVTLDTSYDNAVSVALQLLLGTFELADTDLAVTAEQASALLPLWTEFRTVSFSGMGPGASADQSSDTEAQVDELTEQIQAEMTAEQLAAIADMQITQETMTAIMEEQGITMGAPGDMGTPPEGGMGTPPEGGMGEPPEGGMGEPPEGGMGTPPEGGAPEGGQQTDNGEMPDMTAGGAMVSPEVIDALIQLLADVSGEEVTMEAMGGPGGPPSDSVSDINKTGAYEQNGGTASESGVTYAATQTDESAVYVYGGGSYTLSDATLTKTGDTSGEGTSNFYGNNAIVLAEDESTIILSDCSLSADSLGSNGAFAYGEGSSIIMDNCTISTTQDSSRGVDATYGGSVTISNSEIHTLGAHSAALATDRYEDNDPPAITADNVTATTAGDGSPGIYSTGTFYVSNSNTVATGAEAAAIEGLNSITLVDSDITGYKKWGVFLYQSMSGDSSIGVSTFDMTGGSLTNNSTGPVFMVLNTETIINLEDVDITTSGDVLIRATDASDGDENVNSVWGTQGGNITFTATDQVLAGTVSCNELSSIDMTLLGSSTLSGAVEIEEGGEISLTLADSAVWTAAGDSYVTSLNGIMFSGDTPTNVDAGSGVVIYYDSATDANGNALSGTYTLASGGTLVQN
jgi:hypothetical protein